MTETVHFNIYEEAKIYEEEVCGPCEYDGSSILIFTFQNELGDDDCVAMTKESAACLACGINYYLDDAHCPKERPERPAWQRYGRGLLYLSGLISFVYLIVYLTQRLI
jgi:hypothetical protein